MVLVEILLKQVVESWTISKNGQLKEEKADG